MHFPLALNDLLQDGRPMTLEKVLAEQLFPAPIVDSLYLCIRMVVECMPLEAGDRLVFLGAELARVGPIYFDLDVLGIFLPTLLLMLLGISLRLELLVASWALLVAGGVLRRVGQLLLP